MPKKENKKLKLDLTIQPDKEEYQVTVSEILEQGTKDEKLIELQVIAALLRVGKLDQERTNFLADAIQKIGEGTKPHVALGLNTKRRISAHEINYKAMLVDSLISRGLSREVAQSIVETLNWKIKAISNEELINRLIDMGATKQKALDFLQKYPPNLLSPLRDKNKFREYVKDLGLSEVGETEIANYYYQSFQTELDSTGKLKKAIQRKRKS